MELIIWILIYSLISVFAYIDILGLDCIAKEKKDSLIKLGYFKFLFVRYRKNNELKDYINKKSLIFQILHIVFTLLILMLAILNIFIIRVNLISSILFYISIAYFIIWFMALFNILDKLKKISK